MGFLDDAKDKLTAAVDAHGDKIAEGLEKAGDLVDEKTGGKYTEHIETGTDKAADALDSLDGRDDDLDPRDVDPRSSRQPGLPTDPGNPATG